MHCLETIVKMNNTNETTELSPKISTRTVYKAYLISPSYGKHTSVGNSKEDIEGSINFYLKEGHEFIKVEEIIIKEVKL